MFLLAYTARLSSKTPQVFFIPGFDPLGLKHTLKLIKHELNQFHPNLSVKRLPRQRNQPSCSCVVSLDSPDPSGPSQTLFILTIFSWDVVVREYWETAKHKLLLQSASMYAHVLSSPRLTKLLLDSPAAVFTVLWPLIFFIFSLSLSSSIILLPAMLISWKVIPLSFLLGLFVYLRLEKNAQKRRIGWLFRALYFSYILGPETPITLQKRLSSFSAAIAETARVHPEAPIHIVGHSVGSYLSLIVTHKLTKILPCQNSLRLTTLGQNPAVWLTLSRKRAEVRQFLRKFSDLNINWTDIVSHDDWMSFSHISLDNYLQPISNPLPSRRLNLNLSDSAGLQHSILSLLTHQFLLHFQYMRCGVTPHHLPLWLPLTSASKQE